MKDCTKCHETKPLSEFYNRSNKCKDCTRLAVKLNREKNANYYLKFDRMRANNPDRVEARKKYSKSARYKEVSAPSKLAWAQRNRDKRAAHQAVSNALRDGRLVRGPCEECGSAPTEAHHDDYSKQLEVRWFCIPHHAKLHVRERALPKLQPHEMVSHKPKLLISQTQDE